MGTGSDCSGDALCVVHQKGITKPKVGFIHSVDDAVEELCEARFDFYRLLQMLVNVNNHAGFVAIKL